MRILVFSDTHRQVDTALGVIKKEKPDLILHAGDLYRDARGLAAATNVPVHGVTGNCDAPGSGPASELLSPGGKKILLIHGHQYRVKSSHQGIFYLARQEQVDAVVFGHTHVPLNEVMEGILLFNPGSISLPQPGGIPTYGLLQITGDEPSIDGRIVRLDKKGR